MWAARIEVRPKWHQRPGISEPDIRLFLYPIVVIEFSILPNSGKRRRTRGGEINLARLRTILASEEAKGLDPLRRVAMMLTF